MDAPDSDPETPSLPAYERLDDTSARADQHRLVRELRRDVAALLTEVGAMRTELAEARGAARTWRIVGGVAASAALALGAVAVSLGAQASADHPRVERHETLIDDVREDIDDIRQGVARLEGRLGQPRPEE